jgi:hypothetical protein
MMKTPPTSRSILPVVVSLVLIGVYAAVAIRERLFLQPDFNYGSDTGFFFLTFHPSLLASCLWKIALLLPATVILAWVTAQYGTVRWLCQLVRLRRLPLLLSIVALIALIASAGLVFHWTELTDDENTYQFQAKTLLSGHLYNPPPPTLANFENTFIINDGAIYAGKYPIGHPLFLGIGMLLGHESALTFLMSAGLLLIVASIARRLYGEGLLPNLAALLVAVSPFFYLVSSSRLSHTSAAFCLGLFFLLFLKLQDEKRTPLLPAGLAFAAGLSAGLAANMRPLTAIAFLFPFLALLVYRIARRKQGSLLRAAFMALGFLIVIAGTLLYNHALTGRFLIFPGNYYGGQDDLGFGPAGHGLTQGLANLGMNLTRLNVFLFGFPLSLIFAALVLMRGRLEQGDRLLLAIVGCSAIAYIFYWFPGVGDLGPIYYYETLIPLVILSGRGILLLHRSLQERWPDRGRFVPNFLILSVVLALTTFLPERLLQVNRLTDAIRKPYDIMQEAGIHNAVVFLVDEANEGWVFGHRNNSPALNDDLILCRLADRISNSWTADAFADRSLYVLMPYGTPRSYDLRKVDRQELLSTDWFSILAEKERAASAER